MLPNSSPPPHPACVDFHSVSCLLQLFYGAEPAHTFHYSYPKPQEVEVKEQHVKEKVKLDQVFLEMNNSPSPKRCPMIILLYQKEQLKKNVVI